MNQAASPITPVILAGGSGERLWPLSKTNYPKQFVHLEWGEDHQRTSLFQDALLRVADRRLFSAPLVLCNEEHRFIVSEQLRHIGIDDAIILIEPVARNTAPALAIAALHMAASGQQAVMLVLPSDHRIKEKDRFLNAIHRGARAASDGHLLALGIVPTGPETGYGYIRPGEALSGYEGVFRIHQFTEKPDAATAASYISEGGHIWNSGIFLMHSQTVLEEFEACEPVMLAACRNAYAKRSTDGIFARLDKEAMHSCPSNSIDYAVMEHTSRGVVMPVNMTWCDLGSWTAFHALSPKDAQGNATAGKTALVDSHDCYIHAGDMLVAGIGLDQMVIVASDNALLVGPKDRMQDIRALVEDMHRQNLPDTMRTTFSHRPWGSFYNIDRGRHYQVKRLHLKPGGKISLQMHEKRSEHWIVVEGKATVTTGERLFTLEENQSTYIAAGTRHRLENRQDRELIVIEVQTGPYLGEDDIRRFEDVYNR